MKMLIKLMCLGSLGLFVLTGCFDDDDKNSIDEGPSTSDISIKTNDKGIPEGINLTAAPQANLISLNWTAIINAVDYRVSRQIEAGDAVVNLTGGASNFSFSAQEASTYTVSVAAINSTGNVISVSKVITVNTPSADALKLSDEGL